MDTKDIDRLFSDEYEFLKYSSKKISLEEAEVLPEEELYNLLNEIYTNIMSQIESDDKLYEYFKSKKNSGRYSISLYYDILSHTKKHIDDMLEEYYHDYKMNADLVRVYSYFTPRQNSRIFNH